VYVAIVDDHAGLREAIAALLDVAGFSSRGFSSAEEFMSSPEMDQAACLVLDQRLPGIDGLALQRRLAPRGAAPPIVFISAHEDCDPRVPARALRDGAIAFFRKPFDDDEFLGAVRRAWQIGAERLLRDAIGRHQPKVQ
jgi:FixJ family two-component response regulator